MDDQFKYALIVFGVVVVLLVVSKLPGANNKRPVAIPVAQFETLISDVKNKLALAKQDNNLLLGLLHANAALSKLHAIQQLDASRSLGKKLDLDFEALRKELQRLQQDRLHDISNMCSGLEVDSSVDWAM